ncbi:ATP-binding cassette domain-containing protein [Serpentinicella alkaliphila]|uniref:ABC-2 type transport system ATP-binding protein n=1 Tax=Serpentinicella alkaliphila TaxID=1734049 RepID=A0A4R2T7D9_9FIRM|nr:ABC transporter ATP-binding protein [Serpentinicella alkaliphila]QUH26375.1 ABC transporter ATP-binding protein [Serpentinicella alkaliphila]TCP97601.1 ABC-2 type transport system ATP-binding protein [Serpentinicella alkaliphila]
MTDYVINTKGLMKSYGSNLAINNISIDIKKEGIIGLIGRNGSGKTTFMRMCAGLLNKTDGDLQVLGGKPMDNLEIVDRLVYTYHNMAYDNNLKLIDIINSFQIMYKGFDVSFALKLLKYFELNEKQKYKSLSQGMASVFNFICAISTRAELTMLDEPVLGMDITVRRSVYEVLLRDYTENPRTIIISSHLLSELEGILSEIILINKGQLLLYKDIDEMKEIAYRVDGNADSILNFTRDKKVIYSRTGLLYSFSIVFGNLKDEMSIATKSNITLSTLRPEDLCMYLTQENKEEELKCLWEE